MRVNDSTYSSGSVGLLVADGNSQSLGAADATFYNYSVTAVPEPSTYAMIGGALVLGYTVWRRRRQVRV